MKLFELIKKLISERWHGELRIKFYDGKIAHCEKVESLDVETLK